MPNYWTDAQIDRFEARAILDVVKRNFNLWDRSSIAITSGTGTYTLPKQYINITNVKWLGKTITPLRDNDPQLVDEKFLTRTGTPTCYVVTWDGDFVIRFLPIPNVSVSAAADESDTLTGNVVNYVTVSGYRKPDTDALEWELPDYVARHTMKPYSMWQLLLHDNRGNNPKLAQYYRQKYEDLMAVYRTIKSKHFASLTPAKQPQGFRRRGFKRVDPFNRGRNLVG